MRSTPPHSYWLTEITYSPWARNQLVSPVTEWRDPIEWVHSRFKLYPRRCLPTPPGAEGPRTSILVPRTLLFVIPLRCSAVGSKIVWGGTKRNKYSSVAILFKQYSTKRWRVYDYIGKIVNPNLLSATLKHLLEFNHGYLTQKQENKLRI